MDKINKIVYNPNDSAKIIEYVHGDKYPICLKMDGTYLARVTPKMIKKTTEEAWENWQYERREIPQDSYVVGENGLVILLNAKEGLLSKIDEDNFDCVEEELIFTNSN